MNIRLTRLIAACVMIVAAAAVSLRSTPGAVQARPAHRYHGTLIVDYTNDVSHLDPARCYDLECWPWMHVMYDQLLGYQLNGPNDLNIIPSAASRMPKISDGGRIYTFSLRRDVHFWNGKLVTAADWKYSFERVINPKTEAGAESYWNEVVGAKAYRSGKATHVSGIRTIGKWGLRITLQSPDASFLSVLAMPTASVLERAQVNKYGKSYDSEHPMGTGPYMFKSHALGQKLLLVPNSHYFKGPTGHVAQIEADFGVNENTGLLRVERGQADLDGDGIPAADFLNVIQAPKWKSQVFHVLQVGEWYIAMNTQMKYFNNVLVRRAVNMVINKPLITRLVNGRGRVATTVLPPNVPGHRSFNLYPYNVAKAKHLMAKAGYAHGFSTNFYTDNVGDDPRISQAIVPMLAQIGIKASLRILNGNTFVGAVGTKGKVPISWDGVFADFPDPNVFWEPVLSCESAIPGSINEAWYCDRKVDALGRKLKTVQNRSTRMAQYGKLDRMIMQDAPIVPVYYPVYYDIHSTGLHNYFYHVVWEYVFEQYTKS